MQIEINNDTLDQFVMKNQEYLFDNKTYYENKSGLSEYRLYSYLTTFFDNVTILDIGTLRGTSAIALSHNETNQVITYNLVDDIKNDEHKIYSKSNIEFRIRNVLDDLTPELIKHVKIVMIDIDHLGHAERQIIDKLVELRYNGIILLDDLHHPAKRLNKCMQKLWIKLPYPKVDITKYGHYSGTGLLNFDRNIEFKFT